MYADPLTKAADPALLIDFMETAELDFRHNKQRWDRVLSGKEQVCWEEPLRAALEGQDARLEYLLKKGSLSGGALY